MNTHNCWSEDTCGERVINKIKNLLIWKGEIPLSLFGVVNQMWCALQCSRSTDFRMVSISLINCVVTENFYTPPQKGLEIPVGEVKSS